MILSGKEIQKQIEAGQIHIDPYNPSDINPNSYNLHLHNQLREYTADILDMKQPNPTRTIEIPPEGLILRPGHLYLGRTVEYTRTDSFVPMLEGRSSVGRLGMYV